MPPSIVQYAQGLNSNAAGFIAQFDSSGTYQPTVGNLVVFGIGNSPDASVPSGWGGQPTLGPFGIFLIYKVWALSDSTTAVIVPALHSAYVAYEISLQNPIPNPFGGAGVQDDGGCVQQSEGLVGPSFLFGPAGPPVSQPPYLSFGAEITELGGLALLFMCASESTETPAPPFDGSFSPPPITPLVDSGFIYDGYSYSTYDAPPNPDQPFDCLLTSFHLASPALGLLTPTVTFGSDLASISQYGTLAIVRAASVPPPGQPPRRNGGKGGTGLGTTNAVAYSYPAQAGGGSTRG